MNANLLSTAIGLGIMAVSAAATANAKKTTITHTFGESETLLKVPGEGLRIDVSIGDANINIYPHITKDSDRVDEFTVQQTSEKISFSPEAYRRCWRRISESERYKTDREYARRMRIAMNFAIREFKKRYGDILS
jgi:hypothetical protein